MNDSGWGEYSRLVLKELETLAVGIKELNESLQDVKKEIAVIRAREDNLVTLGDKTSHGSPCAHIQ